MAPKVPLADRPRCLQLAKADMKIEAAQETHTPNQTAARSSGGHVRFPVKRTPALDGFLAELLAFPNGVHDDQVDSTSLFLGWLNQRRRTPQWEGNH
jgi:phage terminase large subunit-like protein